MESILRPWAHDVIVIHSEIHLSIWDAVKALLRCPIHHQFQIHTDCVVNKHELEESISVGRLFPTRPVGMVEVINEQSRQVQRVSMRCPGCQGIMVRLVFNYRIFYCFKCDYHQREYQGTGDQ